MPSKFFLRKIIEANKIKRILHDDELELLRRLSEHHYPSLKHSYNVAEDCIYVASKLKHVFGFTEKDIDHIRSAALLHDIGKLNMELIVLDLGVDYREQIKICESKGVPISKNENLLSKFTMRDLIDFRTKLPKDNPKHISKKDSHELIDRLTENKQIDITVLKHIQNHVFYTKQILKDIKTHPKIIELAASHHPEYKNKEKEKIETIILSIVDKFNAMIQSEGVRNYTNRKGRAEALDLLIKILTKKGAPAGEIKTLMRPLAEKYLPIEAQIIHIQMVNEYTFHHELIKTDKDLEKLLARVSITIQMDDFFKILPPKIHKDLDKLREEIEEKLSKKK